MDDEEDDREEIEITLLRKPEVFVYRIPPRAERGHVADSWKECIWRGRIFVVSKGRECEIRLFDVDTNKLFARCPVPVEYGNAVERAVDSSRYFTIRLDDGKGRHAFVGMGFERRNDAFDFMDSITDWARVERNRDNPMTIDFLTTGENDDEDKPAFPGFSTSEEAPIKIAIPGVKVESRKVPTDPTTTNDVIPLPPPPGSNSSLRVRKTNPIENQKSGSDASNAPVVAGTNSTKLADTKSGPEIFPPVFPE